MNVVLLALGVVCATCAVWYAGKRSERNQVHKWLRFLHNELNWREIDPRQLAAMISIGQHYDLDDDLRDTVPHTLSQKREIYARLRAELEQLLGPHCVLCGSEDAWAVDHEGGTRVYSSRRVNSITRLKWYLEDAKLGLVRRLCNSCNGVDGDKRRFYTESNIDNSITT